MVRGMEEQEVIGRGAEWKVWGSNAERRGVNCLQFWRSRT